MFSITLIATLILLICLDTKVSPALQLHEKNLKKAQLISDINNKLLNRPGPLELIEKRILGADKSLTEAIKGELNQDFLYF